MFRKAIGKRAAAAAASVERTTGCILCRGMLQFVAKSPWDVGNGSNSLYVEGHFVSSEKEEIELENGGFPMM